MHAGSTRRLPVAMDLLWRPGSLTRSAALVLGGSALLAVSAKVQVPFWPVPMTMQSLAVVLVGIGLGSRLGVAAVLAYLAEGFLGLPVFAGPLAGPAYMAGPTGGYLVGFVLGAGCVGWLAERGWDRSLPRAVAAMAIGHALLFVPGVAWLAVLFGWQKAVAAGLMPFLFATVAKTALGAAMVAAFWAVFERRLSSRS